MLRRYFLSTDHKVIGLLYGFTSLFFLLVGFALVLIIRWQPAYPSQPLPLVGGLLVGAFGNYIVPLQLGAPDMAFPRLNLASYWCYAAGGAVMLASFFVPGGAANNGWTSYPRCPTSHRATARRCGSAGCCSSSFRRSSAPSTSSRPSCNCTRREVTWSRLPFFVRARASSRMRLLASCSQSGSRRRRRANGTLPHASQLRHPDAGRVRRVVGERSLIPHGFLKDEQATETQRLREERQAPKLTKSRKNVG